jgi:FkbM family methyltransferase
MKKIRLMKRLRPHLRNIEASLSTKRDRATGFLYQGAMGHRVFLKSAQDYIKPKLLDWLCREIYFKFYLPGSGDTVIDIGAGLGHEAVWLGATSGTKKYFGVEIQPSIYECLCNTLHEAGFGHQASGVAIADGDEDLFLRSAAAYQIKSTLDEDGYIRVPTIGWNAYLQKFGIAQVDLLKINIEGGEKFLLPALGDFSRIRRIIISAHDFRADAGDGEFFRTHAFVKDFLIGKGYQIRSVGTGWLNDWMFAERS